MSNNRTVAPLRERRRQCNVLSDLLSYFKAFDFQLFLLRPRASSPAIHLPRSIQNPTFNIHRAAAHFVIGLVLLATIVLLLFLFRTPLLRTTAHLWIIDEGPARADAIIVLGGGLQNRPSAAAKLYHQGYAQKVIIFDVQASRTTELGIVPSEQELTRRILIAEGVPTGSIIAIGHQVTSTSDEARAVRTWVAGQKPRLLLIPTDPFHTRRVHWLFNQTLKGTSATPAITIAPHPQYSPYNWWTSEEGLLDFQNEIIKYILYRFTESL